MACLKKHNFNTCYSDRESTCYYCGVIKISLCRGERFIYVTEDSILAKEPPCNRLTADAAMGTKEFDCYHGLCECPNNTP